MERTTSHRLSALQWSRIKKEIEEKKSMSKISRKYKISRPALYIYAQRHGWIKKKRDYSSFIKIFIKIFRFIVFRNG
jgi:hypothetical protein